MATNMAAKTSRVTRLRDGAPSIIAAVIAGQKVVCIIAMATNMAAKKSRVTRLKDGAPSIIAAVIDAQKIVCWRRLSMADQIQAR